MNLTITPQEPGAQPAQVQAAPTTSVAPTQAAPTDTIPPIGTPEYLEYMVSVARKGANSTETKQETPVEPPKDVKPEDRPQWLPEKFKSVEDMAKAYGELEKKLSGKPQETPPAAPDVTIPDEEVKTYQGYFDEIQSTGKLSEETYKTLTDKFPKYLVDAHVELANQVRSLNAELDELSSFKAKQDEAEVINAIGGQDAFKQVAAWASQNLNEHELAAFNAQVTTNKETAMLLLQGLKARMENSQGRIPSLVSGTPGGPTGDVFSSRADFMLAMQDPRYQNDSSFRQSVYAKLARTKSINPNFSV